MVAIFTGLGAGFVRGSATSLGAAGQLGSASHGRGGESVSINAATGNLLISQQDEFLIGRGLDISVSRTYNSLIDAGDGDNGDQWQQSSYRRIFDLVGTANTSGSSVRRQAADGSVVSYSWDVARGLYVSTDGDGAHDTLTYSGNAWTWVDGSSKVSETYSASGTNNWRITKAQDRAGNVTNTVTYSYIGDKLDKITSADGSWLQYSWSGNNITQVYAQYTNLTNGATVGQTRTRYAYDGLNRLTQVTVDLSPTDNAIADGKTYVTTYTYHGNSKLIATIGQTDGSLLSMSYDASGRVASFTQTVAAGDVRTTSLTYGLNFTSVTGPDGQTTRLDYSGDNLVNGSILNWSTGGVTQEQTEGINGDTAVKYTSAIGADSSAVYNYFSVVAGETVNYSINLKAVTGSATVQSLGLYGIATGWGNDVTAARIVSGPGQISQYVGGLWQVSGLSTEQPTRIEITRTYSQSQSAVAYLYVDHPNGYRDGNQLIAGGAQITKVAGNLVNGSILNWSTGGVTQEQTEGVNDDTAVRYTSAIGADSSAVYNYFSVVAGETVNYSINLKAVAGSATVQSLGLYGIATGWGSDVTAARIVSGPGQISQYVGGLWQVSGLSTEQATRIEITRTYSQSQTAVAYLYVDHPNGYRDGNQLIAGGAQITKVAGNNGARNLLTKITAPPASAGASAQTVQFAYDGSGNVISVTDSAAKVTSFTYDANGNQLTATDPNGNVVTRTYDANNNKLTETTTGSSASGAAVSLTTRYAYDGYNQLRFVVTPEGRVSEYVYDAAGQIYHSADYPQAAYDVSALAANAPISETALEAWRSSLDNKYTRITSTYFDARGNAFGIRTYGRVTSGWGGVDWGEGTTLTNFTYDQAGRLLARVSAGEDAETFVYDGLNRLIGSTDLAGGTTSIVFNDAATQTVVTLGNGQVTTSTYNKAGDLISATAASDGSPNDTSTYKYDKNGRLRVATDGLGYNIYYVYDKVGRKTAEVSHTGELVEYRYDAANRVVATARYIYGPAAAQLAVLANPENSLTVDNLRTSADAAHWLWNVYDNAGRLVEDITGDGRVTTYSYDQSNRLIETRKYVNVISVSGYYTSAPSAVVLPATHSGDAVTRIFYDRDGRKVGALDAEGYLTENIYDKAGRLNEEIGYAQKTSAPDWASGTFDQLKSTLSPAATANQRLRSVYDARGLKRYTVNAQGFATRYDYGVADRLTQTTSFATAISTTDFSYDGVKAAVNAIANGATDRTSVVTYNTRGQVSSTTDAANLTTYFTYDVMGNVIKTVAENRVTRNWYTQKREVRFTVDAEGFVTEYKYDALGQRINSIRYQSVTNFSDGTSIATVSATVAADEMTGRYQKTTYVYDARGRVSVTYDASDVSTNFAYYGIDKLSFSTVADGTDDRSIPVNYAYNNSGQIFWKGEAWGETAASGDEQRTTSYYYDGRGNLTLVVDPRGVVSTYAYDKLGRVTAANDGQGGQTLYQYDAFGNKTAERDARGFWTYHEYDNLGRLTKTTDASTVATTSTYNIFGELTSVTRDGKTTSFQYDKLGRITRSTDALGFFETYTYDVYGNRTSKTAKSATGSVTTGGTTTYTYDRRGLLLSETLPQASYDNAGNLISSTVINRYEYDAYGNRTKMIEAFGLSEARTTQYVYDKNNRLIQTIGQTFLGHTPNEFIYYDARGNVTATVNAAGGRSVFYYDDLNRKTAEINPVGTYTKYSYDKNGNIAAIRIYETAVDVPVDGGSEEEAPSVPAGDSRDTTFTYDNINRMLTSSVLGVTSGRASGASWAPVSEPITTTYEYDAGGNVVKQTDAYGNATYSYYDALGRKTHQVDQENYLTVWSYNADGNVTEDQRYANKVAGTPVIGSPPGVLGSADDRNTSYAYDLVGNRISETRHNVLVHNGSGATNQGAVIIHYAYNGLGQVVRKTEATGDFVDYTYDVAGRLTVESRKAYQDFAGAWVTPTVDYYYNGVNDVSRTRQRGVGDSAERVTTYGYDGGKLRWVTDAEGNTRYYDYDQGGRQTRDYYTRKSSLSPETTETGGPISYDGMMTSYDVMGRVVSKWQADYLNSIWTTRGPVTTLTYNSFGDVASTTVGSILQQQNQYDLAGRLTGTTSGDGIWKYFGYDKNGNQTVAISSAGGDLGGSFAVALSRVGEENVNATYTVFDKRNMATSVIEEGRRFKASLSTQDVTTSRSYTAFGDVASETNAAGATIRYTYNTMGRMIRSESPPVAIVGEDGVGTTIRPAEDFYYDVSGRLVATRDANGSYVGEIKNANTGNLTILTLLTGTGYDGSQAQVTAETHADGGIKQTRYDIHGDARVLIDEIGRQSTRSYDRLGRMVKSGNAVGRFDQYRYDILGQQLKHWYEYVDQNNVLVQSDVERTDYDIQGRVISQRSFGGDTTTTSYNWEEFSISGVGLVGRWSQTTTMANGLYSQEQTDLFGRITWKRDLGGNTTAYSYDLAGRMTSSNTNDMFVNNALVSFGWFNSGLQASVTTGTPTAGQVNTDWSRDVAFYSYSVTGKRLTEYMYRETGDYTAAHTIWLTFGEPEFIEESYVVSSVAIKNQTVTYDALGRMISWDEAGTATAPTASIETSYDANGNVRKTHATYAVLDVDGVAASSTTRDYWFRYDSMNRVVTNQGVLLDQQIVRGTGANGNTAGQDILYDTAGQRVAVISTKNNVYSIATTRENYSYDAVGRLLTTHVAADATSQGTLRSSLSYNLQGQLVRQTDYDANVAVYSRMAYYNEKGQISSDVSSTKKTDNKIYGSTTSYNYNVHESIFSGTDPYLLGSVGWTETTSSVNGTNTIKNRTINVYQWRDGAVQSSILYKPDVNQDTNYTTAFELNSFGQLVGADIRDGKPRKVKYTLDELGQIIRRDETRPTNAPSNQYGSPHEVWYRFGGRQVGYTGNNGTADVSFDASIAERRIVQPTSPGTYRNGQVAGTSYADFAQNYDPINSYYQGAAGGSYRVEQGDTLASIAQSLYGDSSLWYKIGEANGLSASAALVEGQSLVLPTGVVSSKNNASTFQPYNSSEAIGDLSPTAAKPPKKPKCGVFGLILLAVIAVAVTVVTAGAAAAAAAPGLSLGQGIAVALGGTVGGLSATGAGLAVFGAIGAVAGSVVSQTVGVATGIQDKFSWKGVALAGLSGAVGGAFGNIFKGSGFLAGAARGVASSAVTQGIAVATGLQGKFSWAGVAAAGISGGVSSELSRGVAPLVGEEARTSIGNIVTHLGINAASSIANAATRSALDGSSFGRNIVAAIPDVIGQTLGSLIAGAVAGGGKAKSSGPAATTSGNSATGKDGIPDSHKDGKPSGSNTDNADAQPDEIVVTARRPSSNLYSNWGAFAGSYSRERGGVEVGPSWTQTSNGRLLVQAAFDEAGSPIAERSVDNSFGLKEAKGRLAPNTPGYKYDQDIYPPELTKLIAAHPDIIELADWAWNRSLNPVNDIPFVPSFIDQSLSGSEHGFLYFENAQGKSYSIKLFPDLDKNSDNYGNINLPNGIQHVFSGKISAKPGYELVLVMHVHPFTTESVLIGGDGGVHGPSVNDFNTLFANPTAVGWIKSRTTTTSTQNFFFGNSVYPRGEPVNSKRGK